MGIEILTKQDLEIFKNDVLGEIRNMFANNKSTVSNTQKEWLKSHEVKKLLRVSPGTLQTMRANGTLSFTRIGGIMFYKYEDIIKLLEGKTK